MEYFGYDQIGMFIIS